MPHPDHTPPMNETLRSYSNDRTEQQAFEQMQKVGFQVAKLLLDHQPGALTPKIRGFHYWLSQIDEQMDLLCSDELPIQGTLSQDINMYRAQDIEGLSADDLNSITQEMANWLKAPTILTLQSNQWSDLQKLVEFIFCIPEQCYTAIPYYYRDAENCKASGTIYLDGELSGDQIKSIKSKLDEGEYFIPEDLGLNIPELQDQLSSFPSEADHVWHTLAISEVSTETKIEEGQYAIPAADFLNAFAQIESKDSWDIEGANLRLGLEDNTPQNKQR